MSVTLTPSRRVLIGVALALGAANALSILIDMPERSPTIWFGYAAEVAYPIVPSDPRASTANRSMVRLSQNGASLLGQPVSYTAMINNSGRGAIELELQSCSDGCITNPWFAFAMAEYDTPISTVIAAARAVRDACNVEVVVFYSNDVTSRIRGMPVFLAPIDIDWQSMWGPQLVDTSLMFRNHDETVDHFGTRTGCARISPLHP